MKQPINLTKLKHHLLISICKLKTNHWKNVAQKRKPLLLEQIQIKTIHKSPKSKTPTKLKTKSLKKKKKLNTHKRKETVLSKKEKKETIFSTNKSIKNSGIIVFFPFIFSATKQSLSIKKLERETSWAVTVLTEQSGDAG